MAYRVYKASNYIFVVDNDSETVFEESSSNVLVKKQNLNDAVYDIIFYREQAQVQPFYNLSIDNGDILDETGTPYTQVDWEKWYVEQTGIIGTPTAPAPGPATGISINPTIIKSNNTTGSISEVIYSVSFANIGTAKALVSFDSGITYVDIPPNTSINMDAGSVLNTYPSGIFAYDTVSYPGAYLIITYNA